ncbi:MAG: protein kinase [Acidobacteriia bacterium]|nr:protein kinase [Terriglobia bacterium]
MTPERWHRVTEVFHAVLEQHPSHADEFLRDACGDDAELYAEVRHMLQEHARSGFMDRAPLGAEPSGAPPVFSTGQTVSGRYRIVRFLSRGGMGEVYEAEDLELKERVALKTLLPAIAADTRMIARFKQEIQLSRKIAHPNVCRVFDLARHAVDGSSPATIFFLTMEFLPGETLAARLDREERMGPSAALPVMEQMAEALDAAHRSGIIHRDFKPSNVMLARDGDGVRAVVTDFGLARSFGPSPRETTATATGNVMGTLDYMAPELLTGSAASIASDVYALGMVAYRMITGALPFPSDRPLAGAILRSRVPVPSPKSLVPDLDPNWERAILRALDPEPARRFGRTSEFVGALKGEAAVTVSLPVMTRRRWIAAVVVVVAVIAGWVGWRHARNQPSPEALRWYETGASALRDATYFRAARALERAVSLDPGFALAHARLAEAWNELDDSEKAKEEMLRALPQSGSAPPQGTDALYADAIQRTLTGDFPGAIRAYVDLTGKGSEVEKASVLVDLGRVRERNDEFPKALEAYREAARRDPQNAAAHLRAAMLLGRTGRSGDAKPEFEQADSLYQSLSNTEGQAEVLYQRGLQASAVRKLPEARAALEKAIQLARAISSEHQEFASALQLSVVTYLEGDAAQAEQIASGAVEKARHAGMANLAARGLTDLGIARLGRGDYRGSEGSFREAIELSKRFHLRRNEARARFSLGNLYQQEGAAGSVMNEIGPAISYFQQAGFRLETAQCFTVVARAHRDLGNYSEALAEFSQQLSLMEGSDDRQQMVLAEQGVASVLFLMEKWPDALSHYEQYYELARSNRDIVQTGLGLLNRVKVLWRLGRYGDAVQLIGEAEKLSGQPGSDSRLPSLIAYSRAEMALSRKEFGEAASLAWRASKMASSTKQVQASAKCLVGVVMTRAGSARDAKGLCSDGLAAITALGDAPALSDGRLAMAEILLGLRELPAAQEQVRLALDDFEKAGRKESAWRASAIAASILRRSGDPIKAKDAEERAQARLAELRAGWGAQDFNRYLTRPDIRDCQRGLGR